MQIDRIPFPEVPQFSQRDVAYSIGKEDLRPFYQYPVTRDAFGEVMADKAKDPIDRDLLVRELLAQYAEIPDSDRAQAQVQSLANGNTFTVITAHQPALFTGPLYFIYKICSAINLARTLNAAYPDHHVVPVFITGGEDHDFEEINHARIFGNKLVWENDAAGAVGAMSTDTLAPVLAELKDILGTRETAAAIYAKIEAAYTNYSTYGRASVALVHSLFADTELVVADMARPAFKQAFRPHMEREIFEQVSQPLIESAQAELESLGYSGQAHAREINLFYLTPNRRDRIVLEGDTYSVLDTDITFSSEALRKELHEHPERFSPNVVMRPLFQEAIFPNLAYIGGGGELAYWLERKSQFAAFGLNFPMLIRRNSVLWIDGGSQKKLDKLSLDYRELFREADLIIRDYVEQQSDNELSLAGELDQLENIFQQIAEKAREIDPTLEKAVLGEHVRQAKAIENLEGRLRRTEKQRFDTAMNQIRGLRDKLFPDNSLQERKDNFLNVYLQEGPEMIPQLIEALDPLEKGMVVIRP
ncbi:bacillithiol biosynthesis cysteine-adding enzyme BshC [Lewinella sp. W8]|uniref:bacillithiol biosynthesis cysteine-adding enzyme BshC n=1 Tax=Lewinella sp. W8 TaxID=2528208 RepID=UPI001067B057|nr:bacillithiol biosynthesis cysteine-adding enzyme BshC [Lewinella sp. W8]MTB52148.1 bacillithiol biosynthesis cysteine-adding enzyme BshC [Lewinella sp. W8]